MEAIVARQALFLFLCFLALPTLAFSHLQNRHGNSTSAIKPEAALTEQSLPELNSGNSHRFWNEVIAIAVVAIGFGAALIIIGTKFSLGHKHSAQQPDPAASKAGTT